MIEVVLEVLGELLLQSGSEVVAEMGLQSMSETFKKPRNPFLAAIGYGLFGAIFGGLSLLVFSHHLVSAPWRTFNLVITPIIAGALMALLGAWRARQGYAVLRIDKFAYGYIFALSFGLIRYWFAT